MKSGDKAISKEQWRELKWWSKQIIGTRTEFYAALDVVEKYKSKIDRLNKTAEDILAYCKEHNIKMFNEDGEFDTKAVRNQNEI